MTVKELIAELQKLPKSYEDCKVGVWTYTDISRPKFREYKTLVVSEFKDDKPTIGLYL